MVPVDEYRLVLGRAAVFAAPRAQKSEYDRAPAESPPIGHVPAFGRHTGFPGFVHRVSFPAGLVN
jgi:hypothetical protein